MALILLASAYQFCQMDAKTDDHYFKGFPDYWNVLVFYMFMLPGDPWLNLGITLICVVLVFVPVKYVYPSRTKILRKLSVALACVWGGLVALALIQYPNSDARLLWASLLYMVYYVAVSLYATVKTQTCQVSKT